MRTIVISMVLGACGVLSVGCASVQKMEKEAVAIAKQEQKSGNLDKAVKAAIDGKNDKKADTKGDKADKADEKDKKDSAEPRVDKADKADKGVDEKAVTDALGAAGRGIKVSVKGSVVTLSGHTSVKEKAAAEVAAKKVHGVTSVVNDIEAKK